MQVFEFHFNPPLQSKRRTGQIAPKGDLLFDSFCYEPENIYEKRLGSLFVVGEIKNVLPQNAKFLNNFAGFLKKQYYSSPVRFSPETGFRESLKKSNEFLEAIAKKGDVSWLGNLNLAVLALRNFELNFSKVGTIKILLLRQGQVIDIGKNLEFSEIEPYPLKIFDNIVSGKLLENDIILVLTKEIFPVFSEGSGLPLTSQQKNRGKKKFAPALAKNLSRPPNSVLEKIAQLTLPETSESQRTPGEITEQNLERKLKEILKTKEQELLRVSGVCFLVLLAKETGQKKEKAKAFTFQAPKEEFSFKKALLPLTKELKKIPLFLFNSLKNSGKLKEYLKRRMVSLGKIKKLFEIPKKMPKIKKVKLPKLPRMPELPKIGDLKKMFLKLKTFFKESPNFKRNLILILAFLFFLALGFLIFKK